MLLAAIASQEEPIEHRAPGTARKKRCVLVYRHQLTSRRGAVPNCSGVID